MHPTIFQLKRTFLSTKKAIDEGLAPFNLSWAVLEVLIILHENGDMEQRALQEELELANPTLTRSIDQLVKNGYLNRITSEKDARVKFISLTPSSKKLLNRLKIKENEKLLKTFFQGFTPKDIEKFTDYLKKVEKNMKNI